MTIRVSFPAPAMAHRRVRLNGEGEPSWLPVATINAGRGNWVPSLPGVALAVGFIEPEAPAVAQIADGAVLERGPGSAVTDRPDRLVDIVPTPDVT
jgi:hypothetical protein